MHAAHGAFSTPATFTHIPDIDFLAENEVYYAVPWIPSIGDNYGSARINNQHSIANGLTFRPISNSVHDIHEWWYSDAVDEERRVKMESGDESLMKKEAALLKKWRLKNP